MAGKKNQWFNIYYLIIILLCLMLGLFIWFLFSLKISALESQNEKGDHKDKKTSTAK